MSGGENLELFDPARPQALAPGAWRLPAFAVAVDEPLVRALRAVAVAAPFRHLYTPGGARMSVAVTNCGALGWVSDRRGYRYTTHDPLTDRPWPAMPPVLHALGTGAAAIAGYPAFDPDACLVNCYRPGARLSLHQDRNERSFEAPIVSVSLGLPATFLFGGHSRGERPLRLPLVHGDVLVWGGPSRLRYHGLAPVADGHHPLLGAVRVNLTLRRAG